MVNYPHKISSQKRQTSLSQPKNFANRGMSFEKMINATNDYYLSQGLAVIHKKPTPIQIVRVDYPQRSRAKIVEAYFRQASTTDYSGVYNGYYIDFEAKETKQKTCDSDEKFPSTSDSAYGTSPCPTRNLLCPSSLFFSARNLLIAGIRFDSLLSSR